MALSFPDGDSQSLFHIEVIALGRIDLDIVDDDDFPLPLREFLPSLDLVMLEPHCDLLEPDFVDLGRNILRCAIQSFVLHLDGRTILVDTCIGEHKNRPEIPAWSGCIRPTPAATRSPSASEISLPAKSENRGHDR
jgi:hypothetical protein